ncbi:hypothetical protein L3Q82_001240 [Scortum barcoo]|uniref:Uncharacterized protein n=1 Tax=Scortum barcoo TaxID=214431 RepID=A0ACB8W7G4_9TELE|nr:hypothetical protein L3Q82_001240 [Scortum barcoo]
MEKVMNDLTNRSKHKALLNDGGDNWEPQTGKEEQMVDGTGMGAMGGVTDMEEEDIREPTLADLAGFFGHIFAI